MCASSERDELGLLSLSVLQRTERGTGRLSASMTILRTFSSFGVMGGDGAPQRTSHRARSIWRSPDFQTSSRAVGYSRCCAGDSRLIGVSVCVAFKDCADVVICLNAFDTPNVAIASTSVESLTIS